MQDALNMLEGNIPAELLARAATQPRNAREYLEPGFSLSLVRRPNDRLDIAQRRAKMADDPAVKQNLLEIIDLLVASLASEDCQIWQGYWMRGSVRVEFMLAPSIGRKVMAEFEAMC